MKANELSCKDLMVGDWVLGLVEDKVEPCKIIAKHPAKVVKIEENGDISAQCPYIFDEMYESDGSLIDDFCWYDIEPIPLTTEILEKNGWVYNDKDKKFFPQTWVGDGLMLQGADDCGYCIVVSSDYDDEDTNRTPFILLYVHELQHALRLRRIEKEIIL